MINDHWLVCTKYPVECPLGCQWAGEQGDLDQHLNDGCEEGECQFVTVACPHDCGEADFQRCQLEEHYCPNRPSAPFTCPYCDYQATYITVVNEHLPICKRYPLECPNKCGENAIERQHLPKHLEETCPLQLACTPPEIVMTDFKKHKKAGDLWYSRPFYSHIGGYKMRLRVYANGFDDGETTHVSVFVHLMKGEYDEQLNWPFRGDLMIQLLNQRRDEGHWETTVPFDDTAGDELCRQSDGTVSHQCTRLRLCQIHIPF